MTAVTDGSDERHLLGSIAVMARRDAGFAAILLEFALHGGDFKTFGFDTEAKAAEDTHVEICYPDQGKSRNEIAAPIGKEKLIASDDEEEKGHVMAEAVFAGEDIEEFACI